MRASEDCPFNGELFQWPPLSRISKEMSASWRTIGTETWYYWLWTDLCDGSIIAAPFWYFHFCEMEDRTRFFLPFSNFRPSNEWKFYFGDLNSMFYCKIKRHLIVKRWKTAFIHKHTDKKIPMGYYYIVVQYFLLTYKEKFLLKNSHRKTI